MAMTTGNVHVPPAGRPARMAPSDLVYPPTVAVDPGSTWTAAVLRVDDYPAHGWTIGPEDSSGTIVRAALNDPDNWEHFAAYVAKLCRGLDMLLDWAEEHYGEVRLAVEVPQVPVGYKPGSSKKFHRIAPADWIVPRQVAAAVLGAYPDAVVVPPNRYGSRPAVEYPARLQGRPPAGWGPVESRGGERQHERAAYDVAGAAMVLPGVRRSGVRR